MLLFLIAAAVLAAIGAVTDWRTGQIPNWLTLGALPLAVLAHFVRGVRAAGLTAGLAEAGLSILAAMLCGLVPFVMFCKGGMGGGDVKLFAALGALLQPLGGLEAETYSFIAAAFIAPARLAREGILVATLRSSLALVVSPLRAKSRQAKAPAELMTWFRLGPAILVGTCATVVAHWFSL